MSRLDRLVVPAALALGCAGEYAPVLGTEPTEEPAALTLLMPPVASAQDLLAHQIPVRPLTRVRVSEPNYMTTTVGGEAGSFGERAPLFYVPAAEGEGRLPLYRLIGGADHMDSHIAGEGGYATEGVLGFPWTRATAPPGAVDVLRVYNHQNGDHALATFASPPSWADGAWQLEGLGGDAGMMALARRPRGSYACLSGAGIDLCSDMAAGGSVVHLSWNGFQYVDTLDYGREIQASLNVHGALPTEGGDQLGPQNYDDSALWHGSPVVHHVTDPASRTQETLAIPMEWLHTCFSRGIVEGGLYDGSPCPGDLDTAVAYPHWRLGKRATVAPGDLPLDPATLAHLVRYTTILDTPSTLLGSHLEIPTTYLRAELSRLFTIDASQGDLGAALAELPPVLANVFPGGSTTQTNFPAAGGVVAATADLSYAIGIYADARAIPGLYLTSWRFDGVTKLSAAVFGDLPQGRTEYTTYLVVGSLDHVRLVMRQLYEADVRGGVVR